MKRRRPIFGDLLPWMIMLAMLVSAGASRAAVHPDAEPLSIRPERAAESDLPKTRCFVRKTIIARLRYADGSEMIVPIMRIVPC